MPAFEFTSPEGKVYTVNGPDGATKEQAFQILQTQLSAPKVNKDYEQGRQANGMLQGLASVINGPLMGFGDEVLGAVGGAIDTLKPSNNQTLAQNYRANRDTVRGMQDQQREENPIVTGATQLMASAPTMLLNAPGAVVNGVRAGVAAVRGVQAAAPAVNAARTTGIIGNTLRAGATGAGYGAVGGVGNSTADTAGGLVGDALNGAEYGAAVGAVANPVVAGMGSAGRAAWSRFSETAAAAYAREKIAQALSRDARGNVFTSGQSNPLDQILARQNKLGPEATITDAAGKNTNQLLDTLATVPGRTKESVAQLQHQRTATVGDRLRTAADDALGTQGQRLAPTLEALDQTRRAAAAPLYDQLRQVSVAADPELVQIVEAAGKLGALGEAKTMATALREPFTLDPSQPGNWSMNDLDHVKRGMDALIQKNMTPTGKTTPVGRAFEQLREALVTKLDGMTVDPRTGTSLYKAARDAYAGPSALMDAANKGRQALAQDEAGIASLVRGMGSGEVDAFRIGAFEALRAKLGTQGGQTNIINMWKEPSTRERLQAIFGDERSFREFAAAASREGSLKRIQSVGNGSQTAARAAGMGDLDASALGDLGHAAANAKTGNILGALGSARNAWTRVATPEPVRNEMGRILLSQGPEATQNLNQLRNLIQQINEQNASRASGVGFIGSQIGSQLGNRLMLP